METMKLEFNSLEEAAAFISEKLAEKELLKELELEEQERALQEEEEDGIDREMLTAELSDDIDTIIMNVGVLFESAEHPSEKEFLSKSADRLAEARFWLTQFQA
jgi:hypothetical protein